MHTSIQWSFTLPETLCNQLDTVMMEANTMTRIVSFTLSREPGPRARVTQGSFTFDTIHLEVWFDTLANLVAHFEYVVQVTEVMTRIVFLCDHRDNYIQLHNVQSKQSQ